MRKDQVQPSTNAPKSTFIGMVSLFSLAMLANFLLTPSPFAAFHATDLPGTTQPATYFIAPVYLLLTTGTLITLWKARIALLPSAFLLTLLTLASGFANGLLVTNFRTYGAAALLTVLASSLALIEARAQFIRQLTPSLRLFMRWLSVLVVLGLVLAILYDRRFGVLPFEFSRTTRGEVTLWNLTGLLVIFPTLALVAHRRLKMRYPLVLAAVMLLVIASTVTRAAILTVALPIIIYFVFRLKDRARTLAYVVLAWALILIWQPVLSLFASAGGNQSLDATSGRADLWEFHYETFVDNWLFGAGAMITSRASDYSGVAKVEVGLLAWFSENGIFFGVLMTALVVRAVATAVSLLAAGDKPGDLQFAFSIMLLTMTPSLLEKYARILTIEDFIFWFLVFFFNSHRMVTKASRPDPKGAERTNCGDGGPR